MRNSIEIRHARHDEYDELLRVLDSVFGFPSDRTDGFLDLLPKLYKKEYNPCENNIIAALDGEIVGAVGLYERDIIVGENRLKTIGIGNVACRADMRGEGIMTELMTAAVNEIISRGADLSDLGGRRHRYGHFGYECAGRAYSFDIRSDVFRHIGEEKPLSDIFCAPIEDHLVCAEELYNSRPYRFDRGAGFSDIISSWCAEPSALICGSEFRGYAVVDGDRISELCLGDPSDFASAIRALIRKIGDDDISITLHETERGLMREITKLYDGVRVKSNEQVAVINHRKTVETMLAYSASLKPLPDGEIPLLIHGIAGDEKFTLTVKNGEISSQDGADTPIELSQNEAVALLYGLHSPHRIYLDKAAESWLPLPLYFPSPDCV